jgi:hypothetical protein
MITEELNEKDFVLMSCSYGDIYPKTTGRILKKGTNSFKIHFHHPDNLYKDKPEVHELLISDVYEYCYKIKYTDLPWYVKNYLRGHSNKGL